MTQRLLVMMILGAMVLSGRARAQENSATPMDAVLSYTGIDAWHAAGLDGSGAKIGLIDVGFAGIDALEGDLILPEGVDPATYFEASTAHGTWVYEVLHGIAPGATYYLYQLSLSGRNIPDAVDWLLEMDVDAVNFSASALDIPLNGTNYQSQQLGRLVDADILVVTSAGNYGIGFVTEAFTDTDGDGWHEFQWGYEAMWAAPYNTEPYGETHLRWQDVYTSAEIDLDLYIFADDGATVLKASTRVQQGGSADWPYEDAFFPTVAGTPYYIGIRAKQTGAVPDGTIFYIYADDSTLGASSSESSLTAPADSPKILAVGAIEANETLWARSGRGPTWDGRIKPDLVAPHRLQLTSTPIPFTGTSASTPIVTGAAAIVRAAFPELSEAEVRQWLINQARDLGEPGPDNQFGYGQLWLPPPN
jgi:subtilisin family serine protease